MIRVFEWPGVITTVIAAGCVACAIALGIETDWARAFRKDVPIPAVGAAKAGEPNLLPQFGLPPLEAGFPDGAQRPLFMPSRRSAPAATPAPTMKQGQFILVGTSRTKDFGDSALLKEIASNKTFIVKLGGTINDMTLNSIEPHKVVLKLGDETEELTMKARPQKSPASPPPAAVAGRPGASASAPEASRQPGLVQQTPVAPGSAIFGGAPAATSVQGGATPAQPGALIVPGAPGTPTVFPSAPGAGAAPVGSMPSGAQPRAPTPEEILERRRRARAQQAP